jgi:hypothetical protein
MRGAIAVVVFDAIRVLRDLGIVRGSSVFLSSLASLLPIAIDEGVKCGVPKDGLVYKPMRAECKK